MTRFTLSLVALAAICCPATIGADDFDLTSQRGEVQEFNAVPGHKVDHHGLIINPTPQSITRPNNGTLNASGGFALRDRQGKFGRDLDFINHSDKGLPLTIDFGAKQAKKAGVKEVSGAYLLTIGPKGVDIVGYDERGAFYGLQTLRQILDSPVSMGGTELPMMVVNDYPEMKYRGVVEGFYGTPWSHAVRLSLLDFYGRNKLCDYLYGPKDDPYHSTPNWREPYPADQAKKIARLVEAAKRNRVNFIWAIHPGQDIKWNKEDYDNLVNKFNMMYDLGVRSFAIFFDDIDGEGTNPHRQVELLNNLTNDFVKAKGDVTNLIVCPTDYSQLWAKPGPEGPLAVYGRELNKDVEVFWTGAVVCSDLTPETLEFVDSRIQRPALYWWNYPVTDYCKHILLQGPVYGLDTELTADQVAGIESNPMEHGEASKLALYGVADYSWNPRAYNPLDNWERGLAYMMPDAAEAYRTFAIHSADTETGYRRDESWETVTFPFDKFSPKQYGNLEMELENMLTVEKRIYDGCDNRGLYIEIAPWLKEFTKLARRCLGALRLIRTFEGENSDVVWNNYVANLMSPEDKAAYQAHKIGTMKLQPFYERTMDCIAGATYLDLSGKRPSIYKGVGTYPNLRTNLYQLMLDGDSTTYYTSANSQSSGDWIGVDLMEVRPVSSIAIKQGRNSVDDVDYFERAQLQYSTDGKTWTSLTEPLEGVYDIAWSGEPVDARYVRLLRLDSPKTNWASIRTFQVNPATAQSVGLNIEAADPTGALAAFDQNPTTAFDPRGGEISFDRVPSARKIVVLSSAKPDQTTTLSQYDKRGRLLSAFTFSGAFGDIALEPAAERITLASPAPIHEIIQ